MNYIKVIVVILVMFLGQTLSFADTQANKKWMGTWEITSQWVTTPPTSVPSCGAENKQGIERLSKVLSELLILNKAMKTGDGSVTFDIIYSTKLRIISIYVIEKNFYISITLSDDTAYGNVVLLNLTLTDDTGKFICTDGRVAKLSKNKRI